MKAFVLLKLSSTYMGSGYYILVLIYTALIESFLLVSLRLVEKCANLNETMDMCEIAEKSETAFTCTN